MEMTTVLTLVALWCAAGAIVIAAFDYRKVLPRNK
jgi:hypothetical protein